jgi:hypothetical protein
VADAVTTAFVDVENGRVSIRDELAETLRADDVVGAGREASATSALDTSAFWRSRGLEPAGSSAGKAVKTGITGLRGAQGGIILLGVSGQFLPAAAAVFVASNPVLLGVGALFGGMQLLDDRKRKVQQRRQAARAQMRQFADDVQFEMGNELTTLLRSVQRDLRDEFVELIGELQNTWTAAAKHAEQAVAAGHEGQQRRLAEVVAQQARLGEIRSRIEIES